MAYDPILSAEIEVDDPNKLELWEKTKGNFENHESRISPSENTTKKIKVFQQIVDLTGTRVGSVKFSFLDETDMKAIHGNNMLFPNAQSTSGYDIANYYTGANLPAVGSKFPRASSTYSEIGTTNLSDVQEHTHVTTNDLSLTYKDLSIGGGLRIPFEISVSNNVSPGYWIKAGHPMAASLPGSNLTGDGAETLPAGYYLGTGAQVNDRPLTILLHKYVPHNMDITYCTISNLEAGSSGTLTVNIRKGPSLGSMNTLLSSPLSIPFSSGNYAESAQASFLSNSLITGEHVALDVTSLQAGQTRFLVTCYGEIP